MKDHQIGFWAGIIGGFAFGALAGIAVTVLWLVP